MNEHFFDETSFIGGWYIPENVCDKVIDFFHNNKDKQVPCQIGNNQSQRIDNNIKSGIELHCPTDVIQKYLNDYIKSLDLCILNYTKKYDESNNVNKFSIYKQINIQYYKPNQGFRQWHFENQGYELSIKRHLVFMTYLNNVDDGGTEFKYQNLITPAKKSLTLIWPSQ